MLPVLYNVWQILSHQVQSNILMIMNQLIQKVIIKNKINLMTSHYSQLHTYLFYVNAMLATYMGLDISMLM